MELWSIHPTDLDTTMKKKESDMCVHVANDRNPRWMKQEAANEHTLGTDSSEWHMPSIGTDTYLN